MKERWFLLWPYSFSFWYIYWEFHQSEPSLWLPIVFVGLARCMVCKEGRRKKQSNLTKTFNKTRTKQEPRKQNKPIKKSISDKTDHDVALRWTRTRYHVIVVSHGIRRSCLFVHFNQFCLFAGTNVLPCLPQQFAEYKKNTRRSAVEYNEEQNIDRSVIIHSMLTRPKNKIDNKTDKKQVEHRSTQQVAQNTTLLTLVQQTRHWGERHGLRRGYE